MTHENVANLPTPLMEQPPSAYQIRYNEAYEFLRKNRAVKRNLVNGNPEVWRDGAWHPVKKWDEIIALATRMRGQGYGNRG